MVHGARYIRFGRAITLKTNNDLLSYFGNKEHPFATTTMRTGNTYPGSFLRAIHPMEFYFYPAQSIGIMVIGYHTALCFAVWHCLFTSRRQFDTRWYGCKIVVIVSLSIEIMIDGEYEVITIIFIGHIQQVTSLHTDGAARL
jgi:hypothetical protein